MLSYFARYRNLKATMKKALYESLAAISANWSKQDIDFVIVLNLTNRTKLSTSRKHNILQSFMLSNSILTLDQHLPSIWQQKIHNIECISHIKS